MLEKAHVTCLSDHQLKAGNSVIMNNYWLHQSQPLCLFSPHRLLIASFTGWKKQLHKTWAQFCPTWWKKQLCQISAHRPLLSFCYEHPTAAYSETFFVTAKNLTLTGCYIPNPKKQFVAGWDEMWQYVVTKAQNSTGAPLGCVLGLSFTLLTHNYKANFSTNQLIKFADYTVVFCLSALVLCPCCSLHLVFHYFILNQF